MIRVYPIAGAPRNICAGYGYRTYPDGTTKLHDACDLCAPLGSFAVACDDGTVSWETDPTGGNIAVLRTADGNGYYYAHMLDVQSGSKKVSAGDQIGRVDTTGNASLVGISHVHFQVWPGGQFNQGTVHPDPTADLMAVQVFAAPNGGVMATSNLALAIGGGALILGAAGLAAWAMTENKHHAAAYARENPTTASRCPVGSNVQSLLFSRTQFSPSEAVKWAMSHGYKSGKMDVTGKFIHLTQAPSSRFQRIRTVPFGHGIEAHVGWHRC